MSTEHWMLAASEANVRERGCMTAHVESHTLALFAYGERVYAVDNRCPHMGFPLKDGSLKDGILTCHCAGRTAAAWPDRYRQYDSFRLPSA